MPYIDEKKRPKYDPAIDILIKELRRYSVKENTGDIVYIIYRLMKNVCGIEHFSFEQKSNGIKAFECAKAEYIRMVMNPHEKKKRNQNGEIRILEED